ncbi:GGDEF domain-containing protein [Desulforegula conservatrix]|uniref:GGDEF domain-containing protein n=1 Tax=Desulforegula conservatrix TaxID=153026 RepID=UPI00040EC2DF|nr:diguanylate cyclase [Desulforegula conservatrix]
MFKIFPKDKKQEIRLKRFFMAGGTYLLWVALGLFSFFHGLFRVTPAMLTVLLCLILVINVSVFVLITTGLNKRFKDPSLTLFQMIAAIVWGMVIMYYTDEARGVFLTLFLVIFVFGMFKLNYRQFLLMAALVLVCYSGVILALMIQRPASINLKIEIMNIIVLGIIIPWFSALGAYINGLRVRINRAKSIIERMVIFDELTGVNNRRSLMDILAREKALADRGGEAFSVCIIDVDHFKCVNDTYGHLKGDEVLRTLATAIHKNLRAEDHIARYGGEEFILVLAYPNLKDAAICAERIRNIVSAIKFQNCSGDFSITISIGVSQYIAGENYESVLSRADEALYRAKNAGRNLVEIEPAPSQKSKVGQHSIGIC